LTFTNVVIGFDWLLSLRAHTLARAMAPISLLDITLALASPAIAFVSGWGLCHLGWMSYARDVATYVRSVDAYFAAREAIRQERLALIPELEAAFAKLQAKNTGANDGGSSA
jgi:hypothetical protein